LPAKVKTSGRALPEVSEVYFSVKTDRRPTKFASNLADDIT
jgi:hypothetical protein